MAVIVNKNTTQSPTSVVGVTGAQSIKFIAAPRVYFKVADALTATPVNSYFVKSNGVTPSGWTDMGVVEGKVKLNVEKKTKDVVTGIDQVFRFTYVTGKSYTAEFALDQFDDAAIGKFFTTSLTSVITNGSIVSYNVGAEELTQLAILMVVQNKFDGKEVQYYNPAAFLNFSFEDSSDQMTLKVMAKLPFFTPSGTNSVETALMTTIFA